MTKNTSGGSGHKKRSHSAAQQPVKDVRELARNADNKEVYGRIVRALGNRRFEVSCQLENGAKKEFNCSIRGAFKKLVLKDDYVLVQLFDFNDRQAIILTSYTPDDIYKLKKAKLWDYTGDASAADEDDITTDYRAAKPVEVKRAQPIVARGQVQTQKFFSDDETESGSGSETDEDEPKPVPQKRQQKPPTVAPVDLSSIDIDTI
jgi:translation initiation factor IF-1